MIETETKSLATHPEGPLMFDKPYIEVCRGAYRIASTRISLDSVVYAFRQGRSPEAIQQSFPLLTLEQIYGAITYYLAHQAEMDAYLEAGETEYEAARQRQRAAQPEFYQKWDRIRPEFKPRKPTP